MHRMTLSSYPCWIIAKAVFFDDSRDASPGRSAPTEHCPCHLQRSLRIVARALESTDERLVGRHPRSNVRHYPQRSIWCLRCECIPTIGLCTLAPAAHRKPRRDAATGLIPNRVFTVLGRLLSLSGHRHTTTAAAAGVAAVGPDCHQFVHCGLDLVEQDVGLLHGFLDCRRARWAARTSRDLTPDAR